MRHRYDHRVADRTSSTQAYGGIGMESEPDEVPFGMLMYRLECRNLTATEKPTTAGDQNDPKKTVSGQAAEPARTQTNHQKVIRPAN